MTFIRWCCERGAKSHRKRTKKPWRKRQSRSWRYSFHKYFTTFFNLFLFFNYFTLSLISYTFSPTTFTHTHTHDPHPRPTTSTHYPRPTTFSYTHYRCCLRFSYLAPHWLISRNTITFHKYFWCSRFCEFHSKVKVCFLRSPLRWLTTGKNAIGSWLLNFRIRMFVKSAVIDEPWIHTNVPKIFVHFKAGKLGRRSRFKLCDEFISLLDGRNISKILSNFPIERGFVT